MISSKNNQRLNKLFSRPILLVLFAITLTYSCGAIPIMNANRKIPKDQLALVALDPRLLLKSLDGQVKRKLNSSTKPYLFYTTSGEHKIEVKAVFVIGQVYYLSTQVETSFNVQPGETVFICPNISGESEYGYDAGESAYIKISPTTRVFKKKERDSILNKSKFDIKRFKKECAK
ncbi:MAG: hypothetical protein ABUK01_17520 [Leptospirales bacterium]